MFGLAEILRNFVAGIATDYGNGFMIYLLWAFSRVLKPVRKTIFHIRYPPFEFILVYITGAKIARRKFSFMVKENNLSLEEFELLVKQLKRKEGN